VPLSSLLEGSRAPDAARPGLIAFVWGMPMEYSLDQNVGRKSSGKELLCSKPAAARRARGCRRYPSAPSSGDQLAEEPVPQESRVERRVDPDRRRRLELMTREELIQELYTDRLTGLPNRRAYEEAEPKTCQAVLDVDGLKWVNDRLGHPAGDALIRAVATALMDAAVEAFRVGGDEFICLFENDAEAEEKLGIVARRLEHASFLVPGATGRVRFYRGIGISYGIGRSLHEAEVALRRVKTHRQLVGLRAERGERPPMLQRICCDQDSEPAHRAETQPRT
jgi:diguanylate cyclase (GGDEF)-like protein